MRIDTLFRKQNFRRISPSPSLSLQGRGTHTFFALFGKPSSVYGVIYLIPLDIRDSSAGDSPEQERYCIPGSSPPASPRLGFSILPACARQKRKGLSFLLFTGLPPACAGKNVSSLCYFPSSPAEAGNGTTVSRKAFVRVARTFLPPLEAKSDAKKSKGSVGDVL